MSSNPLQSLAGYDQSPWYDNIQRSMILNGELKRMITEDGLKGLTSNPAIFEKAIAGSKDYDQSLSELFKNVQSMSSKDIFFHLAIEDIQMAADAFHETYVASKGRDGYVSLEVSPDLARDTQSTINEARDLFKRVNRPNLMIKVPATAEGLPAIETLISEGININATLLFSVERYKEVMNAYIAGLEKRAQNGQDLSRIASVASFFVSRVDNAVDKALQQRLQAADDTTRAKMQGLLSKAAVANAKVAYQVYRDVFNSPRFNALRDKGAQPQRLLWASTGTKNPDLSEVLYIEELIGPGTVTTIPPATYKAFNANGKLRASLEENPTQAHEVISSLEAHNIDLKAITDELESQGVDLFANSFNSLLNAIEGKRPAQMAGNG